MLASILATTAIDDNQECFRCDGPKQLVNRWNPNESGRIYWIDDAFGPTQLRLDFVDAWIEAMPYIKTAIDAGNRFVLTSRSHIWKAARDKLGTRNLAALHDGNAVVDVKSLSPDERRQIIYNHIKAGNQPKEWKLRAKPHLQALADHPNLLPEIARRLGDSRYTSRITSIPAHLLKFVSEPAEFLEQTILELPDAQQAALTLVFLFQSRLLLESLSSRETELVSDKYGESTNSIAAALPQLEGAFVSRRHENQQDFWSFFHPTFMDAVANILSARPDLVDFYVRGVRIETLLAEARCSGINAVGNAVVIPSSTNENLIDRLLGVPDTPELNQALYFFLAYRATEEVALETIQRDPSVLRRQTSRSWRVGNDPRLKLVALANKNGNLDEDARDDVADTLRTAGLSRFDLTFMDDDDVLSVFRPRELVRLTAELLVKLTDPVAEEIQNLLDSGDPDYDLDDHFFYVKNFLEMMANVVLEENSPNYERALELLEEIEKAKRTIGLRERNPSTKTWNDVSPAVVASEIQGRSVFSDVDE